MQVNYIFV